MWRFPQPRQRCTLFSTTLHLLSHSKSQAVRGVYPTRRENGFGQQRNRHHRCRKLLLRTNPRRCPPVASGGTGITSFGTGVATWLGTPSSANLAAAVTDETGSGALVFGTSPTFTTSLVAASSTMALLNTTATTVNAFGAATAVNIGAATGTLTVANTTLAAKAITASTTLGVTGATTLSSTLSLGGTVSGGGNQINNVIIGTSNPLAGSFTTVSATGSNTRYSLLSGGATTNADFGIGRTAIEHYLGIAGITNNYITGTAAGDLALNIGGTNKLLIGVSGSPVANISSTGLAVTGTLSATSTTTLAAITSTVTAANNLIVNRTDNGPAIVIQTNGVNKGLIGGSGANLIFQGQTVLVEQENFN